MVESYHEDDAYTTYTSTALPNRNEIIGILCDIRAVSYTHLQIVMDTPLPFYRVCEVAEACLFKTLKPIRRRK